MQENTETFTIEIVYQRHSEDPARVFRSMSGLIESFGTIDNDLISCIGIRTEPILLLEDIQVGSLRSVLRNALTDVDDEAIKAFEWKKIVGTFLYKGKHRILHWLDDNKELKESKQLAELRHDILDLARDTNVTHIPCYEPIPFPCLVRDIEILTNSLSHLGPHDSASYTAGGTTSRFNTDFVFPDDIAEKLLNHEKITNRSRVILKVKKPDFLGESMWEFQYAGHVIRARISDQLWLRDFQSRTVAIIPGDSLRVVLESTDHYGENGEVLFTKYAVLEVLDVMKANRGNQRVLPGVDWVSD